MVLPPFFTDAETEAWRCHRIYQFRGRATVSLSPREEVLGFHMPGDVALAVTGVAASPGNWSLLLHLKEVRPQSAGLH